MTLEQYERWKDFARRMVNVVIGPRRRAPSRADVLENIEFFFECRMEPDEWQRVEDWDYTKPTEDEKARWPGSCMCVGDHITDLEAYFIPGYWGLIDEEAKYQKASTRFRDPVAICVRAGLDIAVSPSAGVCGYSAGDIRKMYPEGVPDWVKVFFKPSETVAMHPTNIEGIYVPEVTGFDERTFDEFPDEQAVWL